jgi:TRAP-type mannitol/chloroaromatic compound transport system permease small subunit
LLEVAGLSGKCLTAVTNENFKRYGFQFAYLVSGGKQCNDGGKTGRCWTIIVVSFAMLSLQGVTERINRLPEQ